MSLEHVIQTAIEVILVAALLVGFKYEDRIARWEQGVIARVKKAFSRHN